MFKPAIFLLVLCTVVFKANSLECYACYDCDNLSDNYVTSCDSLLPNTTTTTTTNTTTAQPTSTSSSSTPPTTTNSTTPSTNTSIESTTTEAPQLHISLFAETDRANTTTWECFNGTLSVNGSDVIVRGCAAGRTNETCEQFGLKSCSFCSTDKCNAAGSIQASAAVLAVMLITYLVKEF